MSVRVAITAMTAAIIVMACTDDPISSNATPTAASAPVTIAPAEATSPAPSTVPSDTLAATRIRLISIQVSNGFCITCDARVEFTGRAFVLGNRDVNRDKIEVVAQGVIADHTWALWSLMLNELAEQDALGHDYGCPSCLIDGAAAIMVVDVDGEQRTTTFDLGRSAPGLAALRGRTADFLMRAERCQVGNTFEAIDCTGPFTATIGQPE